MEMSRESSGEGPSWLNESIASICRGEEGLDDISIDIEEDVDYRSEEDECVEIEVEDDCEQNSIDGRNHVEINNGCTISTVYDILSLDLKNLTPYELRNIEFISLEMAYKFYYWFASMNGFGARKSKVVKNKNGETLQQTFVCYRQGFREDRGLTMENRKRDIKSETRCGCEAKLRVHIDMNSRLWYITYFLDDHNHALLEDRHCRMLASHRTMTDSDVMQLNNMRAVGIGTPHIYGSLANQCGGYDRVGFRRKDLYNQIGRQRKLKNVDAKVALQYLAGLGVNDPLIFFRHTVDKDNRLQHLFWSDGIMQMDYRIFGDVLAFDATYGKNKYECPLVIFSGVNHHNHTVVFGAAVVANETEETYVWILERFLEAMKGKCPMSVITDGDVAIRNSIRRVLPNAHHRLCAWHLLRNATTNVGNPIFTSELRKCMLGDYEVGEFKRRWTEMISKFELQHHPWVLELYEKRTMWCTAYIRGSFFAGFRTTSRCEALHSQIAKFVYSRYNLTELLQHFYRCLNFMRYREVEADFESIHGQSVLRTHFQNLERYAANVFTREIFNLFRPILDRSGTVRVVGCKKSFEYLIYTVSKYESSQRAWHVSFQPSTNDVKCSCRRMESLGLPCDHILRVLVYLNISKLPKCLVLKRWTKSAKEDVRIDTNSSHFWGSEKDARYLSLMEHFKDVSVLAAESFDEYDDQRQKAINERNHLMAKKSAEIEGNATRKSQIVSLSVSNPAIVRTKGGRSHNNTTSSGGRHSKLMKKCSSCKQPGHNRRSCPTVANHGVTVETTTRNWFPTEDDVTNSITMEMNDEMDYHDNENEVGAECHSFSASTYNIIDDSYMQA
ncbi:FAR1-RELATED SEQUENCE 5 [Spatholobus suberectus]|nr:FAR1-RELATED SEQUENCE 5 [Spatholobus suberectus]